MKADPFHQFEIKKLIDIQAFGMDISITNSSVFMLGAVALVIFICHLGSRNLYNIPTRAQALVEMMHQFIFNLLKETAGEQSVAYFPIVLCTFLFITMCNLLGMIPYGFTVTSHIIVTFAIAMIIFILVTIVIIVKLKWQFFSKFMPSGVPLALAPIIVPVEVISYVFRPISLAVRLFANMLAGHVMLKIFASFIAPLYTSINGLSENFGFIIGGVAAVIPFAVNVIFTGFEFFVALVQAYIFTIISCIYIRCF